MAATPHRARRSLKFLIDECLSPTLVDEAHRLKLEAYHVAHVGQARSQDWRVASYALANDLILTTNNAADFRRLYARHDLHPGLLLISRAWSAKPKSDCFRRRWQGSPRSASQ